MDLHDNLALSTSATAPQPKPYELTDRDRESLHRVFNDMRSALAGSNPFIAAVPHP